MSVSLVGTAKTGFSGASASFSVTTPAGTQVGDLIRVVAQLRGNGNSRAVAPDGAWSEFGFFQNASGGAITVLTRVATVAGAQTFTFTINGTAVDPAAVGVTASSCAVVCKVFRSQKSTTPTVTLVAASNGTTQAVTFSAATTTEDAEYIDRILGGAVASGSTDEKSPTWDAEVDESISAQGNNGNGTGLAFLTVSGEVGPTPAGAVGTRSLNLQNTPSLWTRLTLGVLAAPTGAPANTVAPVVTGTAAVGAVLSSDAGTWDQTGLTFTRQWTQNNVNIPGATGSTYTVSSSYTGRTIRCVVTATGTGGSTPATSNGITIPNVPENTVAPAITPAGPYETGDTVTVDNGTWTPGSGLIFSRQWYRGASPIAGATDVDYVLQVTDEGANIYARVLASNGGAPDGVTADSNIIVPDVSAPLTDDSFLTYLSGGTGNTDPALSIGGARGGTLGEDLMGPIPGTVAQVGGVFYRVIYFRNTHSSATAADAKLFIEEQFDHPGLTVAAAVPSQGVNTVVPALASQTTAPSGVTWTTATDPDEGLDFGDLGPGDWRGVYLRFTVAAGTAKTPGDFWTVALRASAA